MTATTPTLSPACFTVLCLLADDLTNKEIAAKLGVSPQTVKNQITDLLRHLQARSRTGAVLAGMRLGLLPVPVADAPVVPTFGKGGGQPAARVAQYEALPAAQRAASAAVRESRLDTLLNARAAAAAARQAHIERLAALLRTGMRTADLAEAEGVSRQAIWGALNKAGYRVGDLRAEARPVVAPLPRATCANCGTTLARPVRPDGRPSYCMAAPCQRARIRWKYANEPGDRQRRGEYSRRYEARVRARETDAARAARAARQKVALAASVARRTAAYEARQAADALAPPREAPPRATCAHCQQPMRVRPRADGRPRFCGQRACTSARAQWRYQHDEAYRRWALAAATRSAQKRKPAPPQDVCSRCGRAMRHSLRPEGQPAFCSADACRHAREDWRRAHDPAYAARCLASTRASKQRALAAETPAQRDARLARKRASAAAARARKHADRGVG